MNLYLHTAVYEYMGKNILRKSICFAFCFAGSACEVDIDIYLVNLGPIDALTMVSTVITLVPKTENNGFKCKAFDDIKGDSY